MPLQLIRFHVYNEASGSKDIDILVDDCFVYESDKILDNLDDFKRVVNVNPGKSVFYSDASIKKSLEGFISLHKRSGVVFAINKKYVLSSRVEEADGKLYIEASEMDKITGAKSNLNGKVTIEQYADSIGKKLSIDKVTDINDGSMVIGDTYFDFPEDATALKRLNDFIFYYRPNAE